MPKPRVPQPSTSNAIEDEVAEDSKSSTTASEPASEGEGSDLHFDRLSSETEEGRAAPIRSGEHTVVLEIGPTPPSQSRPILEPPKDPRHTNSAADDRKKSGSDEAESTTEDGTEVGDRCGGNPQDRVALRNQLMLTNGVALLFWISVGSSGAIVGPVWDSANSAADIAVIDSIRSVAMLAAVALDSPQHPALLTMAHTFNVAVLASFLTAKFWVYEKWIEWTLPTLCVVAAPSFAALTLLIYCRFFFAGSSSSISAKRLSLWVVLRPFLLPRGRGNQLLSILQWAFLLAGEACTIAAPIFLGRAVAKLATSASSPSSSLSSTSGLQQPSDASEPPGLIEDIVAYVILQFLPGAFSELKETLGRRVWLDAEVEAAGITFRHLHTLSLDWHLRKKLGSSLRSMDRGLEGAGTFMRYLMWQIAPTIVTIFATLVVFLQHFRVRSVLAVCHIGLALYILGTYAVTMWRTQYQEELNEQDNDTHDMATDSLLNFETVKYFSAEDFEVNRYVQAVEQSQRQSFKTAWAESVGTITQGVVTKLCVLAALIISAKEVLKRQPGVSAGDFVAIESYVYLLFGPLQYLGFLYADMVIAVVDMKCLAELLSETPDIVDHPAAKPITLAPLERSPTSTHCEEKTDGICNPNSTIVFHNVRFRYPTQAPDQGLHDIFFTIPAGTTTAVVGKTGSGKTTLSRLLFRFYDLQSGSITIGGQDISKVTQQSLRRCIGMVPQDTCMFNDTIRFNIAYGRPTAKEVLMSCWHCKAGKTCFWLWTDQRFLCHH